MGQRLLESALKSKTGAKNETFIVQPCNETPQRVLARDRANSIGCDATSSGQHKEAESAQESRRQILADRGEQHSRPTNNLTLRANGEIYAEGSVKPVKHF